MVHNIVIAGRTESGELLNKVANGLRTSARLSYAGQGAVVSIVSDMDTVEEFVGDGDLTALITMDKLSSTTTGQEISISQKMIKEWERDYPEMTVILIVHSEKKGGVKLNKLYEGGYFNAIYNTDFNLNTLIELIQNKGRSKADAYSYYGLKAIAESREDGEVLDMTEPAEEGYQEEAPARQERPRRREQQQAQPQKKKRPNNGQGGLMYMPKDDFGDLGEEDDYEDTRRRRPAQAAPKAKPKPVYDEPEEDEGYEDDYYDDDGEYEDEAPAAPATTQRVVPAPKNLKFFFGTVTDVDGDILTVQVPLNSGSLDRSFEGTQVFFMGSVR